MGHLDKLTEGAIDDLAARVFSGESVAHYRSLAPIRKARHVSISFEPKYANRNRPNI
jgi:hypothetical protein